jgi:hypothetical protein
MSDRFLEERLGGGYVTPVAQPEVHRLPGFVHCSIQVYPSPTDPNIGLVDAP